jgi:PAX-interacting protein 1
MHGLQFQVHNQGQSPPNPLLANQSQAYQQLLSQNIQNSIPSTEVPIGANFPSAMPPISGLNQTSIRNVVGQDMNVQNIFGTSQNLASANNQWQMQGRHQEVPLQQQQSQIPQQNLYQQQLQQQLLKQKLQQGSIPHLLVQPHIQQKKTQQLQQQQNLLGANQLQSSQQSVMRTSFFVQPSVTQSYPLSGLQQNQQPSIQQATQSMVQQYPQSVLMQQQQPQQAAVLHQHQTPMQQQQPVLPPQQQLMGQLSNASNMQQDLLLSQWSGVGNMQQQLGFQSTNSVLQRQQPQLLGTQSINSSMQTNHHPEHMLQQSGFLLQSQSQQSTPDLLPTRGKQLQSQRQPPQQQRQQLIYQIQSQPSELHQEPNSLHRDLLLHRLQASGQESSFKYHIWLLFSLVIICTSIYFIFNILGDS